MTCTFVNRCVGFDPTQTHAITRKINQARNKECTRKIFPPFANWVISQLTSIFGVNRMKRE